VAKRAVVTGFILPVVMVREEMEERERVDEKFGKGNGAENRLSKRVIAAFPKVGLCRALYMRFWAHQNEVQKVDCIDL
jgi:hypothetical protein